MTLERCHEIGLGVDQSSKHSPLQTGWQQRFLSSRWCWILGGLLLVLFALSHSFSSFAPYDDESYVMLTTQTVLNGQRLYGETYSQYGPAFYLLQVPIHDWLNIPITHDVVRIKTVILWLLVSGLMGWLVTKATDQVSVGVLATLLMMIHLDKLGLEPAHPQEWIALATALALLLVGSRHLGLLAIVGCCAAIAGMIKVNSGAILAMPLMLATVSTWSNRNQAWHLIAGVLGTLCLAVPASMFFVLGKLMVQGQTDGRGNLVTFLNLIWPAVVTFSAIAVLATLWFRGRPIAEATAPPQHTKPTFSRWKALIAVAIGGAFTTAGVIAWTLSTGTTIDELSWGVVGQHGFMIHWFYNAVTFSWAEFILAVLFAFVALENLRPGRSNTVTGSWLLVVPLTLALVIYLLVHDGWMPLEHGGKMRGAARFLALVGPLLMPCLLIREITAARVAIALTGCLGPLLAFPVVGTQLSLGTVSTLVGLLIATDDARRIAIGPRPLGELVLKNGLSVAAIAILVTTVLFTGRWIVNEPLDQPGCRWVRLDPEWAEMERGVAEAIRKVPGEYLACNLQNPNRFYFWTDKRPLTAISPTVWPLMLTPEQQSTIAVALAAADDVCVVKVPGESKHLKKYAPEIEHEMFRDWRLVESVGPWEIGLRPARSTAD